MNRKTKGALAVGAGAILLLGGAGSYALWSDEADVVGGNIATGDFGLDCGTGGAWTDISTTMNGGASINTATDLMVPGDVWKYSGNCTVTATGKNMKAELGVSGITGTPIPYITTDTQVGTGAVNAPVVVSDGDTLPVAVTVTFDMDTPNQESTNEAVTVGDMKITLNQVRP
ncbi:alternate-type signal peptide domain-containing protein [Gordonia zhaorongruii]|uniref:alternate-type signal peptide domain-containing protein n=1 Tax=Gordonia zhaorongruii TaxID=2597659 RepID=UPI00104CD5EA|nr:alternate-type signal peptide domain-containing protein [Gordonia zhaorongruii]